MGSAGLLQASKAGAQKTAKPSQRSEVCFMDNAFEEIRRHFAAFCTPSAQQPLRVVQHRACAFNPVR